MPDGCAKATKNEQKTRSSSSERIWYARLALGPPIAQYGLSQLYINWLHTAQVVCSKWSKDIFYIYLEILEYMQNRHAADSSVMHCIHTDVWRVGAGGCRRWTKELKG